jgi:hypothetical protein
MTIDNNTLENSENIKNIKTGLITDLTHKDVTIWLNNIYGYDNSKNVNYTTIEILTIYINAQKILYTESKTYCEQKLYLLMIPSIIIAAITGVFSFMFKNESYGSLVIACISAFNSLLLTLVTYLKLDGKAEAHKSTAYQFEKLQCLCEFQCSKILFNNNNISSFIDDVEIKVKEIKETNQFILPEYIRYNFPYLTTTNIFSVVKNLQYDEELKISDLKNKMNMVSSSRHIHNQLLEEKNKKEVLLDDIIKINKETKSDDFIKLITDIRTEIESIREKADKEFYFLDQNIKNQNSAIDIVVSFGKSYQNIDQKIKDEIEKYRTKSQKIRFNIMNWLKT